MDDDQSKIDILIIDESVRAHQIARLDAARARRDDGAVANARENLKRAAQAGDNTMPATIDAVRAYATLGEICDALRDVYGLYEEPAF
jgi:methylmalonyl-CoA mutase N-terminal domain/subunit